MKHDDETDLLSEARRRPLSRDEETRLEELVERSPEARVLHYAGWAFDRDSSAREDDDVLVARLAARAAERVAKPVAPLPIRRRRRPFVTLLAAALAVASTAGAGAGVVYLVRAPERAAEVVSPAKAVAAVTPKAKAKARGARPAVAAPVFEPEPALAAPVPEPVVAPVPEPAPIPAVRSAPKPKRVVAPDALSARALFGEANQKRLAGDTAGAVALYKLLSERHPGSAEADLAELSLGKLLLGSGDASGALTHFKRAGASGGALGSEALWGEAGALKALGRTGEERATLERLLSLHPDGAYARAARKRLGTDAP